MKNYKINGSINGDKLTHLYFFCYKFVKTSRVELVCLQPMFMSYTNDQQGAVEFYLLFRRGSQINFISMFVYLKHK